jgi:hypothetical protein
MTWTEEETVMKTALGMLILIPLVACGEDGPPAVDTEGCEHLEMGPYAPITATVAKDAATPQVAADHKSYTVTLPATGIGYVAFQSPAVMDFVFFLDRDVPFAVQTSTSMPVTIETTEKSSAACTTIKGKYTVPLGVGTFYVGLGPDSGGPVNVVVEESAAHSH